MSFLPIEDIRIFDEKIAFLEEKLERQERLVRKHRETVRRLKRKYEGGK